MSLTKTYETKILRTTYEVSAFTGASAESIKRDLAGVPDEAAMVESWDNERGGMVMKFKVEKEQP